MTALWTSRDQSTESWGSTKYITSLAIGFSQRILPHGIHSTFGNSESILKIKTNYFLINP